jgi:hypothetical protein
MNWGKRHIPLRILGVVDDLKALSELERLGLVEGAMIDSIIESVSKETKTAINTTKAKA